MIPVEVIYAKETLGTSDTGYGVMLASWGVGMLLGSLVFARARHAPLIWLLALSTLAIGAGYLGLAIAPSLLVACIASVVGGTGNGVQWVSAISAVQELTESGMQARVMAVLESIGAAMPGVGLRDRWLDSCDCDAADDFPGRRTRRSRDRRVDRSDPWRKARRTSFHGPELSA